MNIFVVSHDGPERESAELIEQLSRIRHEPQKVTPVVVVDDRYNLCDLPAGKVLKDYVQFRLEEFLHENENADAGIRLVDPNRLAECMDAVDNAWVVISFAQNDQVCCEDLILKLSRYNYGNPTLRGRNLLFMVPAMHLGIYARLANASFNNLPLNTSAVAQAGQLNRLFLITLLEVTVVSLPLLAIPLRRLAGFLRRVYRGASNAA